MSHRFFEIIPNNKAIDFVHMSKKVLPFAFAYMAIALGICIVKGFNYGIDFKGGTQLHVKLDQADAAKALRTSLDQMKVEDTLVQEYGEPGKNEYLIRLKPQDLDLKKFEPAIQSAATSLQKDQKSALLRFSEDRVYVILNQDVEPQQLADALKTASLGELQVDTVNRFGNSNNLEYLIQFEGIGNKVSKQLKQTFGQQFEVLQTDQVGEKVGKELRLQALGALLIAVLLILVYIWFRFDFEFAPGAIVALVHDSLMVLAVFALFQLTVDLSIVAAVLTIIGFSINDTIVIYDRIRENIKKLKSIPVEQIHNQSINETLSRTVLTSGTVFVAAVVLWILGGPITRNFAIAFTVGVFVGTYSSIFIASPLTIWLNRYFAKKA